MASNTETGHAINIGNFKLLIDKCIALGTAYNPSNTDLSIANMTLLWTEGDATHQALTAAIQAAKNPINARPLLFDPARKLVTRSFSYLKSTRASSELKADAKGLADRFRGVGIKVKKLPDGSPDPAHVSISHQSYVQKADTFKQLVDLYESEPLYVPNEVDLQVVSLRALATQMKTLNDDIGTILAPIEVLRVRRNDLLYGEGKGMIDIALLCKDYVRGLLGATSSLARPITKIKFTRF